MHAQFTPLEPLCLPVSAETPPSVKGIPKFPGQDWFPQVCTTRALYTSLSLHTSLLQLLVQGQAPPADFRLNEERELTGFAVVSGVSRLLEDHSVNE